MRYQEKLLELIGKLKARNNEAYHFFEKLLTELNDHTQHENAIRKLSSCFAITQYGGFTSDEEKLLAEIINDIL